MADKMFFNRDTRVFIKLSGQNNAWEIPVLDGYSFSQATNTTEVSLSEMEGASGTRRARQMFNDSFAPAEWSFSTYAQPYAESASVNRSVEEVLWALLAGPAYFESSSWKTGAGGTAYIAEHATVDKQEISFAQSNKGTLGTADIYFAMGSNSSTNPGEDLLAYKISGCVVNEMSMDVDVEGIATLNWSGFGNLVEEVTFTASDAAPTSGVVAGDLWLDTNNAANADHPADPVSPIKIATTTTFGTSPITPVSTKIGDTDTYVRNRLSFLTVKDENGTVGTGDDTDYTIVLTGGNLTINNNITYITPETLGQVNTPFGHVTGVRSISGSATCYINSESNTSADLLANLVSDTTTVTQDFNIGLNVGGNPGAASQGPCFGFAMPNCHLELPTHSLEDIISVEVNFHALPSNIDSADELVVSYSGAQ